ncbi:MAG TPA: hypothetical protein P5526_01400 [Anaerolineae bacterium]|nr:hypothetical protein [Anaerolineae bacterium]MCB0180035.1 hypothetical protein [Anaerolineae bacterium]MCB0222056.1 hypothetical protein [Anaerolineae bacterium]MCB9103074.1 hypothetical protein [Anaerolineales bacterium]HRV90797.1 hypothetical protein [Anaerolineae bacterium]
MSRIGIIATTLFIGLGYVLGFERYWQMGFVVAGAGLLWLIGERKGRTGGPEVGLVTFVALAALGVYWGKPAIWMLFGTVAALVTWDVSLFSRRLALTGRIENETDLRRVHWQRLAATAGLGLLLGGLALGVAIPISFGGAVGLGLVAVVSLSWVVGSFRRKGN